MENWQRYRWGMYSSALVGLLLAGCSGWTAKASDERLPVLVSFTIQIPGATAAEVEMMVTTRLEESLLRLGGIESVKSLSRPGEAVFHIEFESETRLISARREVATAVDQAILPAIAEDPYLQPTLSPELLLVAIVAGEELVEEDERLAAQSSLQHYVSFELMRALTQIPHVESVIDASSLERTELIELDHDALASFGLTLKDVERAIKQSQFEVGGSEVESGEQLIRGQATAPSTSLSDRLEGLVIHDDKGQVVRVRDVATIRTIAVDPLGMALQPKDLLADSNQPAVVLAFSLTAEAKRDEVAKLIDRSVEVTQSKTPLDIRVEAISENGFETRLSRLQKSIEAKLPVDWSVEFRLSDHGESLVLEKNAERWVRIFGSDLESARKFAERTRQALGEVTEVKQRRLHYADVQPAIHVRIDEPVAEAHGVTKSAIYSAINEFSSPSSSIQFLTSSGVTEVQLAYANSFAKGFDSVQVQSEDGAMVPLVEVAQIELVAEPSVIYREQGQRLVLVSFQLDEAQATDVESKLNDALRPIAESIESLEDGYRIEYSW